MSATDVRMRGDARGSATAGSRPERANALTDQDRLALLRYMLMMRLSEERTLKLYKQGKIPGSFYDGCGQEAIGVGAAFALAPEDRLCILHRDLGAHFVRGLTPDRYMANYMGRSGGVTGGKDGNMHFGERELGCVGMVSMLPDMALVASGLALAFKMRGERRVAMTFFGEGSTANGQWHEAMNMAGVQRLPVVFMLENNQFAYSTPNELEFAVDPIERARTYGFEGITVDGNDVEAVFGAAARAADRARDGGGPTLIECRTMRMHGHGAHDDMSYVPEEMLAEWRDRDPIELHAERLAAEGFDQDEIERLRAAVSELVESCAERAVASPMPDPETAEHGVFADRWEPLGDGQAPWSRWDDRDPGHGPHADGGAGSSNGHGDLGIAA
ncbi:MAG TPA: thiamine pyrophosphate-dependent dehydrogenase E1 component subunit alpha [Solirubrobacterales bacterium]|nr:thiamine pyrophosphate-dependent dehydrogenase E1 component subunit alpha [Solirubrobacterales bacterium]